MSVHVIYYQNGVKMMRPVVLGEQYRLLRGSARQRAVVKAVREGDEAQKQRLLQMNYSCLPNEDGSLKGATRLSNSVGMDIDHIAPEELPKVRERILEKKEELGLLMLELSARGAGYHLVFRRRAELSQEENLQWASELLGVAFDKGAKDITRVFYTTTDSEEDLLFLDDGIFAVEEAATVTALQRNSTKTDCKPSEAVHSFPQDYHGFAFGDIVAKYWELFNDGKEPQEGDRDTLTYQLACDLRHICGRNAEWLDQVIPCYDHFPLEEKRKKIENALQAKSEGMPYRLKQVLSALKSTKAIRACGGTLTTPPEMPKRLPQLVKC